MNKIKELLESHNIAPFRAGNTNGGEWHSSCPGCGGDDRQGKGKSDRFQIWPNRTTPGPHYYCRQCGAHGDSIQFLRDFDGKSYKEACAILGINPADTTKTFIPYRLKSTPRPNMPVDTAFTPRQTEMPAELWMAKATIFASWAHQQLEESAEGRSILASRGLTMETAKRYTIGYNPGDKDHDLYRDRTSWGLDKPTDGKRHPLWLPRGLVMPLYDAGGRVIQLRIRRRAQDLAANAPHLKYQMVEGGAHATMILEPQAQALTVVESGLDAYLVAQEGRGLTGAATTWNAQAKPDAAACEVLAAKIRLLIALDSDEPGERASVWWLNQYRTARRLATVGYKDPGDAMRGGVDIRAWLKSGLPPAITMYDLEPLACSTQGQGGGEVVGTATERPAPAAGPQLTTIAELKALLTDQPVRIAKSADGYEIRIQWTPQWRASHQEEAKRISELVFSDSEVGALLDAHPAKIIFAGNMGTR